MFDGIDISTADRDRSEKERSGERGERERVCVCVYVRITPKSPCNVFLTGRRIGRTPPGTLRILFVSRSFMHPCVCRREPVRARAPRACVCTITPITSHTSVCGGDEDEKKPAEMRAGGKKDPDCESPVGAKDVYTGARSVPLRAK